MNGMACVVQRASIRIRFHGATWVIRVITRGSIGWRTSSSRGCCSKAGCLHRRRCWLTFHLFFLGLFTFSDEAAHHNLKHNMATCHRRILVMLIWRQMPVENKVQRTHEYVRTWTSVAAISIPATQPPTMRPSLPTSATLKPPVLLRVSPSSASRYEPDRERISKWPCDK